jgi:hypothetical protein
VWIDKRDGTAGDEAAARLPQQDNCGAYVFELHNMDVDHDGSLDLIARPWDDQDPNPLVYLNSAQGAYKQGAVDIRRRLSGIMS